MSRIKAEADERYPEHVNGLRDFKAWARRFVYRHEHGDKSMTEIQIKFSRMALGIEPMPNAQKK